ncbi:DUF6566 family protein [Paraburkholderia sp. RAU2J]|uniref:DUF6566 family protein n=1 Tax=Paraburkholderia sp. RAU2J TaxID=1938810 RepID=UPI0011C44A1B|nr:DUF6566 family protein [Paraburkholderia sp. RAU2J]
MMGDILQIQQELQESYYFGYLISSTAQSTETGAWVPWVEVTLRGRLISAGRECPNLIRPTREEAMGEALAWARNFIERREVPLSAQGNELLSAQR